MGEAQRKKLLQALNNPFSWKDLGIGSSKFLVNAVVIIAIPIWCWAVLWWMVGKDIKNMKIKLTDKWFWEF